MKSPTDHSSLERRVQLAALWTATTITIALVDLFSLYREDVRAQIESGTIFVFDIGPGFLLGVLVYVLVPTLMIPLSVALPRRSNRVISIVAAALMAVTIVGGAIGEWSYYILGSAVEIILLGAVITQAIRWRAPASTNE